MERALNATDPVFSSNAADITSSHTLLDTLMADFPHSQVNNAPDRNRWRNETVPHIYRIWQENFY